jgi:hypothetical protein
VKTWWGSDAEWLSAITLTSTFDQSSTINWSITISLSAIGNGEKLVTTATDNIPAPITTDDSNNLGKFDQGFMALLGKVYNDFSQQLSDILKDIDLSQIVTALEGALNNQRNYFVFPGADTFFFKDPLFNNEGDLLITVTYNFY